MPSSHVVPDRVDVAFDDQRAVTSAGLLPPAALAERLVLQPEIVTLLVSPMWHADGMADGRMRGQQAIGAAPGCCGPLRPAPERRRLHLLVLNRRPARCGDAQPRRSDTAAQAAAEPRTPSRWPRRPGRRARRPGRSSVRRCSPARPRPRCPARPQAGPIASIPSRAGKAAPNRLLRAMDSQRPPTATAAGAAVRRAGHAGPCRFSVSRPRSLSSDTTSTTSTPNRAYPALRVGVGPWRPHRRAQHLDPLGREDRVERGDELGVPIAEQNRTPPTRSSRSMNRLRACCVTHSPAGCGVTLGTWTRRRCGIDASAMQDGPHGAGPDPALVTKPAQLTVDATVARGRVLPGQPQH